MTEKTGREIKSFDDLIQKEVVEKTIEKEVRKYDSAESEAYDKYFLETGRSINDFANLRKDWSKESDDNSVMEYLKQENPYLSTDEIKFKLDTIYDKKNPLSPEDYSAEEIANRDKEIRMRDIEWKELVAKSRKFHDVNKQKYLTPLEEKMQAMQASAEQGKKLWEESIANAIPENLEFGDFNYAVKDTEKYKKSLGSIESFLDMYKGEDGKLDANRFAKTIIAGEQVLNSDLLKAHGKHVQASVIEEQMRKKSNATSNPETFKTEDSDKVQAAKEEFRKSINANNFSLGN